MNKRNKISKIIGYYWHWSPGVFGSFWFMYRGYYLPALLFMLIGCALRLVIWYLGGSSGEEINCSWLYAQSLWVPHWYSELIYQVLTIVIGGVWGAQLDDQTATAASPVPCLQELVLFIILRILATCCFVALVAGIKVLPGLSAGLVLDYSHRLLFYLYILGLMSVAAAWMIPLVRWFYSVRAMFIYVK